MHLQTVHSWWARQVNNALCHRLPPRDNAALSDSTWTIVRPRVYEKCDRLNCLAHVRMESGSGEVIKVLQQMRGGDREAEARLSDRLHSQLYGLAEPCMLPERSGHTLLPTALIRDEAYLHLVAQ